MANISPLNVASEPEDRDYWTRALEEARQKIEALDLKRSQTPSQAPSRPPTRILNTPSVPRTSFHRRQQRTPRRSPRAESSGNTDTTSTTHTLTVTTKFIEGGLETKRKDFQIVTKLSHKIE